VAAAYAAYFVDSSALVKRHVQETGTSWVRRLTRRRPSTVIHIARITGVEVASAVKFAGIWHGSWGAIWHLPLTMDVTRADLEMR
jgi:hypothetical protein